MTDNSVHTDEIAVEQRHVDRVYTRVDELRAEAAAMRDRGDRLSHGARNEAVFEQAAMLYERDVMVGYANRILQTLESEHEGLVFGRLDLTDGERMYVGRLGVRDAEFDNLVTDWRAPAAGAFYRATAEQPEDVVRRRVIRSTGQQVVAIDDDLLQPDLQPADMRVVGEGALMASLNRARGATMRDIVATIQKEQDEVIRAPWRGVTEITGGPGTGKTAVALHRVAYLLYSERRRLGGAGVLVVGPSTAFTSYISRVLPSMGEDTVELRALGEVLDGVKATRVDPPETAAIKGSLRMRRLLKRVIRDTPPDAPEQLRIVYKGQVLRLDAADLAAVRKSLHATGRPPNRSRVDAAEALLEALWRKAEAFLADEVPGFFTTRKELLQDLGERLDFHRFVVVWWPVLSPSEVLSWLSHDATLRHAAGRLFSPEERRRLAESWADPAAGPSTSDVALLDELRVLIGPPPKRRRRAPDAEYERGSGPRRPDNYDEYSHIVVDESQDLSPMQWRMVGRRGKYASWTVVGDPVQSSWPDTDEADRARTSALGARSTHRRFTLRTNYRNSAEIFELAARVVADVARPDELPEAVRRTEVTPRVGQLSTVDPRSSTVDAVREMLNDVDGTVGVIASLDRIDTVRDWLAGFDGNDYGDRLHVLDGLSAKGLEYDGVVLVDPDSLIAESTTGPRVLYVALTRATQRLTVLARDANWPT
ncbi:DNA helicase IV [Herbihabitans rhizosphaerae]|uniref:DNA helicase IV n=1 Tax=Herbihabitans rhizosphaerae TaxID=1872711 RepID=A0A4Q7KS22_9PSEU|nr:ATP-binding domain-containing protein [Herbihabitans rhizosphaerae]RZS39297.1 DNA helicase IV [Herbihabitans rhizosphaerae]